ncbi:MAG: hypothetical protein ABI488_25315 [Polyangiaceae bacterium]
MSWLEMRVKRGNLVAVFCSAGAIAAACGSQPSVISVGGGFGAVSAGEGGDGSAAVGNGGSAATGNLSVGEGGDMTGVEHVVATALSFDPPQVTLNLDSVGALKTATYTLKATIAGGAKRVVAAESLEFDRPDIASFVLGPPAVLTATGSVAGTGVLHAVFGGLEAKAELTVNIAESSVGGPVAQPAIDALIAGALPADPTLTTLLYPYDKTVFPLGLASPLMMWNAVNPSGDVYRIQLGQKGYALDYFTTVTAPAQVRVPQAAWDRVTSSNTGDPLTLTVSRWDSVTSKAYTSVSETFTVAPESLRGAIYYWTASQSDPADIKTRIGSIKRLYPGEGAKPEALYQGRCMGCHSVSADGSTMVATIEDPLAKTVAPYSNWTGVRAWAAFSTADPTAPTNLTTKSGANSALTPDGKYVVFGGRADITNDAFIPGSKFISLATTATGEVIADSGLDDMVLPMGDVLATNKSDGVQMPSFAPDGTKLALVEVGVGSDLSDNVLPTPAVRIIYLDFDQSKPKFDGLNIHEVVKASALPASANQLGYPSFSPDGKYIAYHSGQYSTGCHKANTTDGNPNCLDGTDDSGELWVSPTAGGAPIRMANLDDPPNVADHMTQREPTFCPISRGGYSWVVFTSMRDWGNAHTGPVINGKRRLWLAAVDKKLGTVDPSHPAFYVEGQDDTPNMRGFWALAQCIETPKAPAKAAACTSGFECCSGFCVDGQCVDKTSLACMGIGDACSAATDCCNSGGGLTDCFGGKCRVVEVPK